MVQKNFKTFLSITSLCGRMGRDRRITNGTSVFSIKSVSCPYIKYEAKMIMC
jgi:hypothetical protein